MINKGQAVDWNSGRRIGNTLKIYKKSMKKILVWWLLCWLLTLGFNVHGVPVGTQQVVKGARDLVHHTISGLHVVTHGHNKDNLKLFELINAILLADGESTTAQISQVAQKSDNSAVSRATQENAQIKPHEYEKAYYEKAQQLKNALEIHPSNSELSNIIGYELFNAANEAYFRYKASLMAFKIAKEKTVNKYTRHAVDSSDQTIINPRKQMDTDKEAFYAAFGRFITTVKAYLQPRILSDTATQQKLLSDALKSSSVSRLYESVAKTYRKYQNSISALDGARKNVADKKDSALSVITESEQSPESQPYNRGQFIAVRQKLPHALEALKEALTAERKARSEIEDWAGTLYAISDLLSHTGKSHPQPMLPLFNSATATNSLKLAIEGVKNYLSLLHTAQKSFKELQVDFNQMQADLQGIGTQSEKEKTSVA